MSNELQVFNYCFQSEGNNNLVRIIEQDGEPWFVAKDVCKILELSDVSMSVRTLDDDEKGTSKVCTPGGKQMMTTISESGLYALIMRSIKPQAKTFRKWVTSVVIPSIRKHGAYMTEKTLEKALTNPDFLIQLAQQLKAEQEKNKALSTKIEEDKPKVLFAEAVKTSEQSILIGEMAKLLAQNGVEIGGVKIGPNRFFKFLREEGYLMKSGESYNMPTQRSMNLGLFEIKERTINNPDGSIRLTRTTKVTGKGQIYFINKFLGTN